MMSLRFVTGVAIALAVASTPALACKGRNTIFSDDFAREDPSWEAVFGDFSVANGRGQVKGEPGKIAVVVNTGDFFEGGDVCLDVIAPDYRGGSNILGGILFAMKENVDNFLVFWVSPPEGTAGVTGRKNGKWVNPATARKSDAVRPQTGAVNTLRLTWKGNTATTYINDRQFVVLTVQPVKDALFGLFAQPEDKIWQFDNYKITD